MSSRVIAGSTVQVNEEGFMTNPNEWSEAIAAHLAQEEGIPELTPEHWTVIEFCRQNAAKTGAAPTLRQITNGSSVTTKDLFKLFPKGPAKKVAKISGLGKPEGCV
jgi:dissimilatory sulfite reductase related protein